MVWELARKKLTKRHIRTMRDGWSGVSGG